MKIKIKMPYEFGGRKIEPISGFSIGPVGIDRGALIEKLFADDPRLKLDYLSDSETLKKNALSIIKGKLDTIYNISPGDVLEVPIEHGELLLNTFGFLQRYEEPEESKPKLPPFIKKEDNE